MGLQRIELGDVAKDTITGFTGVVVADTKWLHGCRRLTLQPEKLNKENKVAEHQTFDEPQCILLTRSKHPTTGITGGPRPEPRRHEVLK